MEQRSNVCRGPLCWNQGCSTPRHPPTKRSHRPTPLHLEVASLRARWRTHSFRQVPVMQGPGHDRRPDLKPVSMVEEGWRYSRHVIAHVWGGPTCALPLNKLQYATPTTLARIVDSVVVQKLTSKHRRHPATCWTSAIANQTSSQHYLAVAHLACSCSLRKLQLLFRPPSLKIGHCKKTPPSCHASA